MSVVRKHTRELERKDERRGCEMVEGVQGGEGVGDQVIGVEGIRVCTLGLRRGCCDVF